MDHTRIPHFALYRRAGTVIVRVKMLEVTGNTCCESEACPASSYPRTHHRPSSCEQCFRTRSNSRFNSDCDSDYVDSCRRPYRTSTARSSRYVNVCAAVCLVLLVGGLSPQSSAAPHKRPMDRQRRSTSSENPLWGYPCDYDPSKPVEYSAKRAETVALQAKNAYDSTAKYKDKFALKLHTYQSFDELLKVWSSNDWLRNFTWFPEEGLPKEKVLYQAMPEEYMNKLMSKIDKVLPSMYKGLKVVVAGLNSIHNDVLSDDIVSDETLKSDIKDSMHNVRAVLCLFNELMTSRNLEIQPLPDSEVPDIKKGDKLSNALFVYRDTLNYLEYLAQVFQKMSETQSLQKIAPS